MSNLKEQVEESAAQLRDMWTLVSCRPTGTLLPPDCYERWEDMTALHSTLSGTVPLFGVRDSAWEIVKSLVDPCRIEREAERVSQQAVGPTKPVPNFSHDAIPMDFSEARHLALTAYVTVAWSIYDRLSNVCGRLAATEDVHGNPKRNPKLCGDLLARRKEKGANNKGQNGYGPQLFAFSMQHHLVGAYAWPANVAYTLRNWLVHEGYELGSIPLFLSDRIEDGLRLHPDAVSRLEEVCTWADDGDGNPRQCCLKGDQGPWRHGQDVDLLAVLHKYHGEIDTMFVSLVKWTVESLVGQIDAFAARDKAVLAVAAATPRPDTHHEGDNV